ncbi:MAG: alpha/beta hydrolase [Schleiferiaceae bacterium]|nr:alpha/beta hydrolase [Schleiferiaceae bacterium]
MPSALYKNTSLYYSERPGKKTVVFLHGFLEDSTMWETFSESFPKKYRLLAIDLFGHGKSDCLGYVHTMEEMAAALKTVLKTLKIKRCHLVGHSMGGYVALAFTEAFPDMVKSLTLFHSTARADSDSKKIDRDRAIAAVKANPSLFIKTAIPNLFAPHLRNALAADIERLIEKATQLSARGIVAALEGIKTRLDREVLLHFGPCPVLFIAGKQDPVLKFEDLEEQMLGDKVTHTLVTENGHMGFLEDTELCTSAIVDFLNKNG